MNIRPWVFSIALAAGCTALQAAPQKNASSHAENLENCLEGSWKRRATATALC